MRLPNLRPVGAAPGSPQSYNNAVMLPFTALSPRDMTRPSTRVIEHSSIIAIPAIMPRKFKVEDLITIIVRQQKKYEADGQLDSKKKWNLDGQLSDWFRFYGENDVQHLGQDKLSNGQPGFKFDYNNKLQSKSQNEREDKFTTRIHSRIIDVKPNGNLVLEANLREAHDEEEFTVTLTGVCRSEDVTPANTILSTQVAEMVLIEKNHGAVRDGTRRGWIPKILDWARPF